MQKNLEQHLTEQQLVDYLQQKQTPEVSFVNSHLIKCDECTQRLSGLLLFALENQLLESKQDSILNQLLENTKYKVLQESFIKQAVASVKKRFSLIKKRFPNGITVTFSLSILK